ncbi:myosin-VIIa [Elysia marginata]|uniref:Myosin-VIIa n=1 Tax=Elysia marginata TaxID=1093978 RepID=A0AAV4HFZ2_9GAST|nr:myosin-VIIa [Elysia marginata]
MPGARRFRGVPYLTLNSSVLKEKYREVHLLKSPLNKHRGLLDNLFNHDKNGYLHSCGEGGGDCDGDFSDWHEGLDDVTRLLVKGRSDSVTEVKITQSAAAAFGDDIADDSYSVSELSQYHEDGKRAGRKQGRTSSKGKEGGNFTRAKLSRLPKPSSVSAPDDVDKDAVDNGTTAGHSSNSNPSRKTSSGSNDPSDDVWTGAGVGEQGEITFENAKRGSVDSESEDSEIFTTSSFASFALTRFQAKMPYVYACCALPHPLLPQHDRADYLAALASWVTILRIMGDLPDVDTGHSIIVAGSEAPLTTRVKLGFKARYTKKDVEDAHTKYSELFKDPTSVDTRTIPFMPGKADTMLDKVQLVCALGIYRTNLRDELYCQLCKQLTSNPSRNSSVRGWVLMALFAGSFTPSERFAPSLTSFLRDGPPEFSEKVDKLLRRTCSSGTRGYPASWLEFQAAKNGKPLLVPVTFMNGHRLLCEVDAATTVCEVIQNISDRLEIKDNSGFSLYISLQNKISCLGSGQHRVMDAISECEQHTKQMGHKESHSLWRLFFRREFFTPWYQPGLDPVSTDMDYQQVRRGLAMGEYKTDTEESLITLAARMFYIDNPEDPDFNNITPYVTTLLPEDHVDRSRVGDIAEKVKAECTSLKLFIGKPDVNLVKADVVAHAQEKFHILFSRYHDASKVVVPEGTIQDAIVGVDGRGLHFLDGQDKPRLHVHFAEILASTKSKHHLTLTLVGLGEITLSTPSADDLYVLINFIQEGMRKHATIAVARQDVTHLDGPADSNIVRGDVLRLGAPVPEQLLRQDDASVSVTCLRTGKRCDVPTNILYMVAPEAAIPPVDVLDRLSHYVKKSPTASSPSEGRQAHTLQNYAKSNFR